MDHSNGHAEAGFSVKKLEPVQVLPSGKTPGGLYLLSNLDQTFPYPIEILFACCLDTDWGGKMMVNCTGDGVPFVEAFSEDEIEVLGDLTIADPLKLRKLIHFNETAQNILEVPPLTVQFLSPSPPQPQSRHRHHGREICLLGGCHRASIFRKYRRGLFSDESQDGGLEMEGDLHLEVTHATEGNN
ncbi:unnamed protein product [Fraxinus pennsylvanica]|uniref:Uncharacterized protein n=1 Tax=Fraxinus pennsylvanica TaxID=56036 RepID=A0AAD1YN85_9LAMI|nr:unnamed protein product [Fraxinus pennsylvanica]